MTAPSTTPAAALPAQAAPERLRWRDLPLRGRSLGHWILALVGFVALWSVAGLLIVGPLDNVVGTFDRSVSEWMGAHRSPMWNDLTWWGSTLADSWVKIPAAIVLIGWFLGRWKRWFEATLLGAGLILESASFVITSFVVGRDRPAIEQLDSIPPTGSFPSGHTAAAVVFYGALAWIVWTHTSNLWWRVTAGTAALLVPIIVALARVYRGMHHVSDVVAGSVLGLASLAVMLWLLNERRFSADQHQAAH